jgi:hypothetical protein
MFSTRIVDVLKSSMLPVVLDQIAQLPLKTADAANQAVVAMIRQN